jgi:predicted nucleic acid-binding protein
LLRERQLTVEAADAALRDYVSLPLTLHSLRPLLRRMLALRDNFSAYDASYVALAELLEAPLLTADGRLARAVGRHLPHVDVA